MSKHETKMTRWYKRTHYPEGYLIEEFMALKSGRRNGRRLMDGIIIFRKPPRKKKDLELRKGEEVVVIQSKNRRLGMGLIGQVIVSHHLVSKLGVKIIKSVGVCRGIDEEMLEALRRHPRCDAVSYKNRPAKFRT
jgi:hypothetical protein